MDCPSRPPVARAAPSYGESRSWRCAPGQRDLDSEFVMPVSTDFAVSNRTQTERMRQIVSQLDAKKLALRLPNGWTIAGILAHMAFWDRQRLCLMRRWAAGENSTGLYDGEAFNAAMQPLLELIPPDRAATAAISAAEEVDAFLLQVPDDVVAAALARPDKPNLDRGSHREYHLDQIERALESA